MAFEDIERVGPAKPGAVPAEASAPVLTWEEAEGLGTALKDHLHRLHGAAHMPTDELGWADLVQFVLRRAGDAVRDREEKEQD